MEIIKRGKDLMAMHLCSICNTGLKVYVRDGFVTTRDRKRYLKILCPVCNQMQLVDFEYFHDENDNENDN